MLLTFAIQTSSRGSSKLLELPSRIKTLLLRGLQLVLEGEAAVGNALHFFAGQ